MGEEGRGGGGGSGLRNHCMCLTLLVNRVKTLYVFQPSSSFALFPNLAEWILRMFFFKYIMYIYFYGYIFFLLDFILRSLY